MTAPSILVLYNEPVLPVDHPDAESEYDVLETVNDTFKVLKAAGFETTKLGINYDPQPLLDVVKKKRPDAIFNLFEGIATQTDLLEAIAGDLPEAEGEEPDIVEREDGSLLIDGMTPAHDAFERLALKTRTPAGDFHTIAGFALAQLRRIPDVGERFEYDGWRFEIAGMEGRRIARLLAQRTVVN